METLTKNLGNVYYAESTSGGFNNLCPNGGVFLIWVWDVSAPHNFCFSIYAYTATKSAYFKAIASQGISQTTAFNAYGTVGFTGSTSTYKAKAIRISY